MTYQSVTWHGPADPVTAARIRLLARARTTIITGTPDLDQHALSQSQNRNTSRDTVRAALTEISNVLTEATTTAGWKAKR
ncbi:hypothetical protein ACFU96_48030 [Streptomyces sp. NPDC057620]|uniref:hypothetical protein n=1 Tax=Streptomyces sp. NPDC057620 TaxID=3346185 RepID=UPI00367DCEB6